MTGIPAPAAHGGDALEVARALGLDPADVLDLSISMNTFAPDVRDLAPDHLDSLLRYPNPTRATGLVASTVGVDADRLVLTNGGAEAIALVASVVGEAAVVEPEFSLYRRHLPKVSPTAGRWRSNPANPLGLLAAPGDVAMVWDEAFYQIATGTWTRGDDAAWRLGSLTKLWNCPGLRLGYAIAPDAASAAIIRAMQPQWSVNGLALALVEPMLERTDLRAWAAQVASLRATLRDALRSRGYDVQDTTANWLLLRTPGLRERLAPQGVIVRDCASFGLEGTYRLALPHPRDLDRVLAAFDALGPPQG